MTAQTPTDRARVHPRLKVFRPAEVHAHGRSLRVHLLDVSRGGARLHTTEALSPGATVVLICMHTRRVAQVAWTQGCRCGIRFGIPLAAEELAAIL